MSVPTWKRSTSSADYIYYCFELNCKLGEIVMKKETKYRKTYGDHLIKTGLEALSHLQVANSIFIGKTATEAEFRQRRAHLKEAAGLLEHLSTTAYIFIELVRNNGQESNQKLNNQEEYIGSKVEAIIRKTKGIIKSDAQIYKKYIK